MKCHARPRLALSGHSDAPVFVRFWTKADKAGFWPRVVCPLLAQSGHSTQLRQNPNDAVARDGWHSMKSACRQSRCVHSVFLQAMHRKISNVERSKVACNVRMRSDLPPHFLQSAAECPVPAVPRGGGSSGGGSLRVVTRLVPDISCKMPLRARVDHGDPM